ncbi:MAG: 50S ribosomal protein L10 [bacterium]|nr:50S ribosomal protein L10 [bacterium]
MLTKQQKIEKVDAGVKDVKLSKIILFGDFSRVKVSELSVLRSELRKIGAKFQVIKKRLLRIIFEKSGIDFNPEQFDSQVGTVFSDKEIHEAAQIMFKFAKGTVGGDKKERFQILGGLNVAEKKFLDAVFVKAVGALPSREVLLGQLLGTIIGPARALLYVLSEKSKK